MPARVLRMTCFWKLAFNSVMASMLIGSIPSVATADENWLTFRGNQRTAVANETGLMTSWPEAGPPLLWQTNGLGRGYSSLSIDDGRIYTMGDSLKESDSAEYLLCIDQSNGEQIWKAKTGKPWTNGKESWQSSRSTPTIDGDQIYVLTAHGDLICFSSNGDEVWKQNLKQTFAGKKADNWGYSESVLIDGDRLICTPGGPENTMVAIDKNTGNQLWSTARAEDRGAGHASIVISKVGDTKVYVQTTGSGAMGVRASDGKLLWTYDIDETTAVIPTPIVRDDLVFFSAGYRRGGALLRQVESDGSITVDEIYPLNIKLGNKHGGIVLVGDYLYGDSEDQGIPFCAEFMTGDVKWKSRGSGKKSASVVAADGHVYFRYSDGVIALVKPSPEKMEEVSSFKVPGSGSRPSWSHPVIVSGKLYLREGNQLFCYSLR